MTFPVLINLSAHIQGMLIHFFLDDGWGCPEDHPYVFYGYNKCCEGNEEGTSNELGDHCEGTGSLGTFSLCCDGKSVNCTTIPCINYPGRFSFAN